MKMNKEQQGLKSFLKAEAASIRQTREETKSAQRNGESSWKLQCKLDRDIYNYRHNHIAYSLSRGKEYRDIETTVRKGNEPSWSLINSILETLITEPEKDQL